MNNAQLTNRMREKKKRERRAREKKKKVREVLLNRLSAYNHMHMYTIWYML